MVQPKHLGVTSKHIASSKSWAPPDLIQDKKIFIVGEWGDSGKETNIYTIVIKQPISSECFEVQVSYSDLKDLN